MNFTFTVSEHMPGINDLRQQCRESSQGPRVAAIHRDGGQMTLTIECPEVYLPRWQQMVMRAGLPPTQIPCAGSIARTDYIVLDDDRPGHRVLVSDTDRSVHWTHTVIRRVRDGQLMYAGPSGGPWSPARDYMHPTLQSAHPDWMAIPSQDRQTIVEACRYQANDAPLAWAVIF